MRIVIIGAGAVGFHLADRLTFEAQEVVLVDSDPEKVQHAADNLDVMTIRGNGADPVVLAEAGLARADIIVVTRLGKKPLDDPVLLNILGFVLLFLALFAAGVLGLAFLGHDLATAIGASVATIATIGPDIGEVGAVDNYGWMDPWSHLLLILLMVVGRLEIFTVLLLFHPGLWRG